MKKKLAIVLITVILLVGLFTSCVNDPVDELYVNYLFGDRIGLGVDEPTAYLHIAGGTATAGTAPLKFNAGTLLTTPEQGVMEYDGARLYFTNTNHRRIISQASDSIITSELVSNTVVETIVFTAILNAGELRPNKVYKLRYYGHLDTASAADTVTVRVYIGGTQIIAVPSSPGVANDEPFHGETIFTIRTLGVAGTLSAHTFVSIGDTMEHVNIPSIVIDTTIVETVEITFQWSAAKADNIMNLDQAFIELLD